MAVHRNKVLDGAISNGHYHRKVSFLSQEVRLLSDHNLPPKKPSDRVRMDAGRSALPNALEEVSFLRLPDVKLVTGLSKSSLYALIRANSFPSPVRLGPRTVAWVRSEIKQWAAERVLTSRSTTLNPGRKRMPQPALREAWASSKKWA
jgi:prophage regulatory protein